MIVTEFLKMLSVPCSAKVEQEKIEQEKILLN